MTKLDDAYISRTYIPDADSYAPRWAKQAADYRTSVPCQLDIPYGPSRRQHYDLFESQGKSQGTLIFVHGGYWRSFDNKSWSHLAEGARAYGWNVAMPTYDLCPTVQIALITQQVAAAVTKIARNTKGPVALAGHSAGGHLVARMLAPGMLHADVLARLTHVMPISMISDLTPLLQTSMNDDFGLDAAMAEAESPLAQPKPEMPVTVWVGADERPAFIDQSLWLASHWRSSHVEAPGKHHFNVIDPLSDPKSEMIERLLALA